MNHQDRDISVVNDALVKNIESIVLLPALLVASVLLFIQKARGKADFSRWLLRRAIPSTLGYHFRPPLRGPPL